MGQQCFAVKELKNDRLRILKLNGNAIERTCSCVFRTSSKRSVCNQVRSVFKTRKLQVIMDICAD